MTVNISETSTFSDPVQAPVDGEQATGASVQLPVQALTNRTRFLLDQVRGNGVDANVAPLQLTAVATDHVAEPTNFWKIWRQAETGDGAIRVREYAGTGGGFLGAYFCKTVNARWDATAKLWQSDETAEKSFAFYLLGNRTVQLHKAATGGTWTDAQWDVDLVDANDGALLISGRYLYTAPRVITGNEINLATGIPNGTPPEWYFDASSGTYQWFSAVNAGRVTFPIPAPVGAIIDAVRCAAKPANTTGTMNLKVVRIHSGNTLTPTAPTVTTLGTDTSDGTTALQRLELTSIGQTVAKGEQYAAVVQASSDGAAAADGIILLDFDMQVIGPAMYV